MPTDPLLPENEFAALGVAPALVEGLAARGLAAPTPIQRAAIPPLLGGRDVTGQAQTGSGKTAAFALPMLQRITLGARRPQGLVLAPTRELALQLTDEIRAFGRRLAGLRVVAVVGGQPLDRQARALGEGAHVVVGTPGRALDHLRRGTLDAAHLRVLVLDEADRLLELGFQGELEAIRALLPEGRQTALFSATFPDGVTALSARWQRDAVPAVVAPEPPPEVRSFAAFADDRDAALAGLLRALQPSAALVFCNFKRVVDDTARALTAAGVDAAALHGDLDQLERDRVMAAFRNGSIRALVATDVAARGLDVDGLPLVVNREVAPRAEDHVHRIGRTGRAGRPGLSWTLLAPGQHLPPGSVEAPLPAPAPDAPPPAAAWVTLRLGAGRRDKLRPADLLGALTGDCGLSGDAVGRFEIHDGHAFVAIARDAGDRALRGLARHGVKGRRVRVERAWPG
jgi:ATP-independent RNA helicase DbpA